MISKRKSNKRTMVQSPGPGKHHSPPGSMHTAPLQKQCLRQEHRHSGYVEEEGMDSGMLQHCWQLEVLKHIIFQVENSSELYSSPCIHIQGCFVHTCSCHEISGHLFKMERFHLYGHRTLQFITGLVTVQSWSQTIHQKTHQRRKWAS